MLLRCWLWWKKQHLFASKCSTRTTNTTNHALIGHTIKPHLLNLSVCYSMLPIISLCIFTAKYAQGQLQVRACGACALWTQARAPRLPTRVQTNTHYYQCAKLLLCFQYSIIRAEKIAFSPQVNYRLAHLGWNPRVYTGGTIRPSWQYDTMACGALNRLHIDTARRNAKQY